MVKGLETFKAFFRDHLDKYILIGGAACDVLFSEVGLSFRATKDLDLVLVVEALDAEFIKKFWQFVKNGQYEIRQKSERQRKYYRFLKPKNDDFPVQLEFFARNPDLLDLADGTHLTPIPIDDDLSSLSAILMDDDYYAFLLKQSHIVEDLHLATVEALLCFKAKAFLDLRKLRADGVKIDIRDIRKHRNDVIRLTVLLREGSPVHLPDPIRKDMGSFLSLLQKDPPHIKSITRNIGVTLPNLEIITGQIKQTFGL